MPDHDDLIDALAGQARPVRRVAPAWVRAALLVPLMLALGLLATTWLRQTGGGWSLPGGATGIGYAVLCILLGTVALGQTLTMSIPGREPRAAGWMMVAVAAWLSVTAANVEGVTVAHTAPGERPFCFAFLMAAGLPMIGVVIVALRRTGALRPERSLAAAAASIAFLSFGLLAFCHPVDIAIADLATHLMAALALALLTVAAGRRLVAA